MLQCVAINSASIASALERVDVLLLQCIAVYCSVLQCVAVCCSVLQCVATNSVVYCVATNSASVASALERVDVLLLQCVAVCCSVFQCVAVCCSVL